MADSPSLSSSRLLLLFPYSVPLRLSLYLYLLPARQGCHPSSLSPPPPSFPPILSGLIVLHLFIQAFMAASSSCRPISPPDDGLLPQLSRLFIIGVRPHHISLTLGRWFSHWAALLTRRIADPLRSARKHMRGRARKRRHSRRGNLTSLYYTADLLGAKMLCGVLMFHSGIP